ncbi:MAG: putative heme-binding protein [Phycisphaerales bacterium]|nr:putative heme-binding protein [Phycisphaerales bacterium]
MHFEACRPVRDGRRRDFFLPLEAAYFRHLGKLAPILLMLMNTLRGISAKRFGRLLGVVAMFVSVSPVAAADDPAAQLQTLPGFKVETVLKAEKHHGSWISLGKDDKGRLLLGAQRGQPVTRLTLENGKVVKDEQLKLPVTEVMGVLYAFDSLYLNGSDGKRFGLFRLRDPKGDGSYDSVEFLREWHGGAGEHGSHGVVLGPDKKLYIVSGNFTELPGDLQASSPHKNYADDLALPRAEDGNGFGAGKRPPGGFITRMDADGKNPELFASGQRNTYDIAFNADGELLGFDSDMEWDWGTPWYRPICVFHATSAYDGGFREGTGKWPEYYPDSLPAVVNVGLGCPTGVLFGAGAKFPAKFQKAFFVLDWTYGRLIAVHTKPHGASYEATWENFVAPASLHSNAAKSPLNLTDVVIGDDGAMYFTVGGRGTQAYLYRVTYTGNEPTTPADLHDVDGAEARDLRHKLEAFHGRQDAGAVDFAWPHLGSDDRYIRYAARIAIEAQPVEQWKQKALAESKPQAALTAMLALARVGGPGVQGDLINAIEKIPASSLTDSQKLEKLRVLEVSISRQGKLPGDLAKPVIAELDPLYPAPSIALNRELAQVLLSVEAPDAVAKTVKLLGAAPTQEEQLNYVLALRTIKTGWTPELREQYFGWWTADHSKAQHPGYVTQWFEDAGRPYSDGASFNNFIKNLHADAQNALTAEEKTALASVIGAYIPPGSKPSKKVAKPRTVLVKEWKMADVETDLAATSHGRNFARGKEVFESTQCLACHRFGNEGGAVGPDLTAVASRFSRHDIMESILDPSKVVSEQYMNIAVRLKNDDTVVGRLIQETADKLVIQPNPLAPEKVTVNKADIKTRQLSKLSPMPEGLVNTLNKDELLDLLAYVESGGRKDHPDFAK